MPVGTYSSRPAGAPSTSRPSRRIVHYPPSRPGLRSRSVDPPRRYPTPMTGWSLRIVPRDVPPTRYSARSLSRRPRASGRPTEPFSPAWPSHRVRTVARRQAPGLSRRRPSGPDTLSSVRAIRNTSAALPIFRRRARCSCPTEVMQANAKRGVKDFLDIHGVIRRFTAKSPVGLRFSTTSPTGRRRVIPKPRAPLAAPSGPPRVRGATASSRSSRC
jgi:hypothetical protein